MKTKTYFAFRIDIWDDTGDSIIEYVAGVDDFEVAEAAYRAAVARWPRARIFPHFSSACASAWACLGSCNHRSRGKRLRQTIRDHESTLGHHKKLPARK